LPKVAHLSGGCAVRVELGHASAVARRFLVLDPRQDRRGDQPAHFFKRLNAVLDSVLQDSAK